jgi:hypothetical protein
MANEGEKSVKTRATTKKIVGIILVVIGCIGIIISLLMTMKGCEAIYTDFPEEAGFLYAGIMALVVSIMTTILGRQLFSVGEYEAKGHGDSESHDSKSESK